MRCIISYQPNHLLLLLLPILSYLFLLVPQTQAFFSATDIPALRPSNNCQPTTRRDNCHLTAAPRTIRRTIFATSAMAENNNNDDDANYFESTTVLTPAGAQCGMTAALAKAEKEGWEVTICICDAGGVPLHVQRTAGAFPASYDVACGKAKSAALFRKETGALEASVNGGRSALLSAPFVLMRGGLPIQLDAGSANSNNSHVCGAVGVSGVQADQDEEVARVAVEAICSGTVVLSKMRSRL